MRLALNRLLPWILTAGGCLALAVLPAPAGITISGNATADRFNLPGFGENGLKAWEMKGRQAVYQSEDVVNITDLNISLYQGGGNQSVESIIASPQATVYPLSYKARGPGFLDIAGASYHVTGRDWEWDGKQNVTRINQEIMVAFDSAAISTNATTRPPPAGANGTVADRSITIHSDRLEIRQNPANSQLNLPPQNQFLFSGNVIVADGNGTTTCDRLDVLANRDALPQSKSGRGAAAVAAAPSLERGRIDHIYARNNVHVRQNDLQAWSAQAELIPVDNVVILSGDPVVTSLTDKGNVVLQGSRIKWWRDSGNIVVDPRSDGPNDPARVRLALPALARYQGDELPLAGARGTGTGKDSMTIVGETLQGNFGAGGSHIVIERSVRLEDAQLNLDANHLEAEFGPASAPGSRAAAAAKAAPASDSLKRILATGKVLIHQNGSGRDTTAGQAELLPQVDQIILSGNPQVVDPLGKTSPLPKGSNTPGQGVAILSGDKITLFTAANRASVSGTTTQPASLTLPLLAGADMPLTNPSAQTLITSDSLAMERLPDKNYSQFRFENHVRVVAGDMESTSGMLEAFARNAAPGAAGADPLGSSAQVGEIFEIQLKNQVVIHQGTAGKEYEARAATAEIYPEAGVNNLEPAAAPATLATVANATLAPAGPAAAPAQSQTRRYVVLEGDPTGMNGPVHPMVKLPPMQDLGWDTAGNTTAATAAPKPAQPVYITSDEMELLTSRAHGNIYLFTGNVKIDSGDLHATCDQMQAFTVAAVPNGPDRSGDISRILAEGHVRIVQGERIATAGEAVIIPDDKTITLSLNPFVKDDKNTASGDIIQLRGGDKTAHILKSIPPGGTPAANGTVHPRPTIIVPGNFFDIRPNSGNTPASSSR